MRLNRLTDEYYFEWLCGKVANNKYNRGSNFSNLLTHLHSIDFRWVLEKDENRAADGEDLRERFVIGAGLSNAEDYIYGPCSVLEMMVALAIRCEEDMMDDAYLGDRTEQWFWQMIVSLGLGSMTNDRYDEDYVDEVIDIFLDREYSPDGRGGLFTITDCDDDLRDVEIWVQLCWYLDSRWQRYS